MFKSFFRQILKSVGWELCRYSKTEIEECSSLRWDIGKLNYKDFQAARAIASLGHITIEEARFLGELVKRIESRDAIIEIGTLFGFSTLALAISKSPSQKLITVDSYVWNPLGISAEAHMLATTARLSELCMHDSVQLIRQDKDEFYSAYKGPAPGLFFCDADHSYEATMKDLQWAKSVGAKIICGHDYDPVSFPGVALAVDELGGPKELVGTVFVI